MIFSIFFPVDVSRLFQIFSHIFQVSNGFFQTFPDIFPIFFKFPMFGGDSEAPFKLHVTGGDGSGNTNPPREAAGGQRCAAGRGWW